ncbi:hypothetical protein [Aquimarina sp. RZ0]|uniref:hypothetical protein n=1 Tax=Aquimarina sp. RZ0 TaxID=2607730 RepID=UPI0011F3E513|nr:hypothetical protein [Aquimarina sp. RZ0]KAA1248136.1 hypothetical protein F0000_00635 [Aquimarina sp. RZ0]
MKVFIKDIANNINIKDKKKTYEELDDTLNYLSNNKYTEIKLYENIISKYKIYLYPISPFLWKIDYPIKLREIHKQCYATKGQCVAIIRELYEVGHIDNVLGFTEVPIQDFTLDEMIEFKKEEEMMLRGEDPFVEEENEGLTKETAAPQEKKELIKQSETKVEIQKKAPIKKEPIDAVKKNPESDNYLQI